MSRPYCGPVPGRILSCGRLCRRPVSRHTQHQGHARAPCRALLRMSLRPCAVSQGVERRILAPGCTVSRHKVAPLSHDTNLRIVTLLPAARTARRIASRLAVSWPSSGRAVAEQWPYRGLLRRVVARPCALPPSLACHDTLHCIVTQHQNG